LETMGRRLLRSCSKRARRCKNSPCKVRFRALCARFDLIRVFFFFSLVVGNSIGVEGGKAIAEALKDNVTLEYLDLRG
jgi:hypothetical protein